MPTDDIQSYNATAKFLHWLIALALVVQWVTGLTFDYFARPTKITLIGFHATFGTLILLLVVARLAWRLKGGVPRLPESMPSFMRLASHGTHVLFYVLLFFVPMAGIALRFAHGHGIDFGLFSIPAPWTATRTTARLIETVHGFAAYTLLALAGLHVLAALYHHYGRGDGILHRMLPAVMAPRSAAVPVASQQP
ncbi:MAG: cytochrome b [Hyphomicrobiales bacterium]|nr:cytochrome b [Hyphomicrobiales bacterium]